MKIRNGFVSNSSSSSFICCICGEAYTGWDASPTDFDCSKCVNGHIICNEHLKFDNSELTDEQLEELDEDGYSMHELQCPICQLETYCENEMARYLEKTRGISRDEVFAKVKEINKRRKKLYDAEYISHVCEKFELTDDKLLSEIKEKFGQWDNYSEFIYGVKRYAND
jgi:hypothetical protein